MHIQGHLILRNGSSVAASLKKVRRGEEREGGREGGREGKGGRGEGGKRQEDKGKGMMGRVIPFFHLCEM